MIYLALALSAITLILFFQKLRTRNKLELLLIAKHRDFMQSLKVNFLGEPVQDKYRVGNRVGAFSIEIGGKLANYNKLFESRFILSRLNDLQVNQLCTKYIFFDNSLKVMSVVCVLAWLVAL